MTQHTKGPWRCVYLPGSKARCAAVESPTEGVYVYLLVAKSDDADATIERWKQDALRIAATLEMYEALKALRSFMWAEGYADQTLVMAQADAAIAKAEG